MTTTRTPQWNRSPDRSGVEGTDLGDVRVILFLLYQDRVRQSVRVQHFHDETRGEQPGYFITYHFSPLIGETTHRLLHRFHFRPHEQRVLSQLPRNTLQIQIGPCKDVPILTEEVDELAFLFVS